MQERMLKYIQSLTQEERLLFCRKQISVVIKDFRAKEKALKSEYNYEGCRTGVRGGKRTTLSARADNSAESYVDSIKYLKMIVNEL